MTAQPSRRRRRVLIASVLALLALAIAGATYASYRVDRFTDSTFRPEATPPITYFGETPTPLTATAPLTSTPVPASPNTGPLTPAPAATSTAILAEPTATPLPIGNSAVIQRLRDGKRVTVLLLGFGGPGHDGGYLTDSIQVMSFEPATGTVTLISVPRDLWVLIPAYEGRGGYWGKINEVYSVGMGQVERNEQNVSWKKHDAGGQLAMKIVAQVLGIPVDYWVSMDFVGFRKFIDALGGVDVDVERAFVDTQYPANDDAEIDPSYKTIRFEAGMQHMDGERAIAFARSRYAPEDGSDFGRARRQQRLMVAVKDQVIRVETIPKVFGLLDALEGHLRMSFSFSEAKDLAGWAQEQARAKRQFTIHNGVLETGALLYADTSARGAYILVPRAGQGDYSAIQRYVRDVIGGTVPGTPGTPGTPGQGTQTVPFVPIETATPRR